MAEARLAVTVAGAVTLRRGDQVVGDRSFAARQLRLVTAMLMVDHADPTTVERLAEELWPDGPPASWRPAVRMLVSQLRTRLVEVGLDGTTVAARGGAYHVHLDDLTVDVERAVAEVGAARRALAVGDDARAAVLAGSARTVLSRPVLPTVEGPWVDDLRDRLLRHHVDALVLLGAARRRRGGHDQARLVLDEALGIDPLREDAWRELMGAEADAGNVGRALATYERCRRHLADALGIDPSAETQALHAALLDAVPVPSADLTDAAGPEPTAAGPRVHSPYPGLRSFDVDDAEVFFGRDGEVQALVDRLAKHHIVAVVGPSGVGKSSLVRAGLLPALARGAIADADTWPVVVVTPGAAPRKALSTELARLVGGPAVDDAETVLRHADGLRRLAEQALADRPATARLLVVVDQFEELFTLGSPDRAAEVVHLLEAATTGPDPPVRVVVTMRADFYDAATEVFGLSDLLSRSQFVVPQLSGEQIEAAVVGPAPRAGLTLEPGLLGRIVTDVANQPGALPLLQHLLYELWARRVGDALTRGAYEDLGGVVGALATRAENVHAAWDISERAVARRVLLRGVQPGEDGVDTKRPVALHELVGPALERDVVDRVVSRLVDARMLTTGHDDLGGHPTVELAHEALIDGWPRLRAWVDEDRRWLLAHRRLTAAATEWERNDRRPDWLLAGLPLDEADQLVRADARGEADLHLPPAEHAFVEASRAAREHDRAVETERRDRERALEHRSLRRLRMLAATVLVGAMVASGLWWNERADRRVEGARTLTATARDMVGEDPQLALLLGLAARDRVGDGVDPVHHEIASVLHEAIGANRVVAHSEEIATPMVVSPDRRLVSVRREDPEPDGTWAIELRRTDTLELVDVLSGLGGPSSIASDAFSGDSRRHAVEASDGSVTVWDLESDRRWLVEDGDDRPGGWISLDREGRYLVRTQADPSDARALEVWDVEAGARVGTFRPGDEATSEPGCCTTGHLHPSDRLVALVHGATSEVGVHDLAAERESWRTTVPGAGFAAWSPNGRWLAVVGERIVVLDGETGEQVVDVDRADTPAPITWSTDSTMVVLGSSPSDPAPPGVWTVVDDDGPIASPGPPRDLRGPPLTCSMGFVGPDDTMWEPSACGSGLRRWDLGTRSPAEVAWLPGDGSPMSPLAFSPDDGWLAASGEDGHLVLYDTTTWQPRRRIEVSRPPLVDLDVSDDGAVLATRDLDAVTLWDTATWEPVVTRPAPNWGRVAVSGDGNRIAWSSIGRTTGEVLDGQDPVEATGELVWVMDRGGRELASRGWGENLEVQDLDFGPDGRVLAVAATDADGYDAPGNATVLWDVTDDREVGLVDTGQEAAVASFDDTGRRLLVTAGPPTSTAEAWDVSAALGDDDAAPEERVARVVSFEGHVQHVWSARPSPDGSLVATCGRDGTARLWDARSGRQVQWLVPAGLGVGCTVAFSGDGRLVGVVDPVNGIRVFATRLEDVAPIARDAVVRSLTDRECREHLGVDTCAEP